MVTKKPAGVKHDQGKPALSMLPYKALSEVAKVLQFGARKYKRDNWKGGFKWTRLADAVLRHVYQWKEGETHDPESGCNHLAHAACGLFFLLYFADDEQYEQFDDRTEEQD